MTKKQVFELFKIIKCAYFKFYTKISDDDLKEFSEFVSDIFENEDFEMIKKAVLLCSRELKEPPTIAHILQKKRELC